MWDKKALRRSVLRALPLSFLLLNVPRGDFMLKINMVLGNIPKEIPGPRTIDYIIEYFIFGQYLRGASVVGLLILLSLVILSISNFYGIIFFFVSIAAALYYFLIR